MRSARLLILGAVFVYLAAPSVAQDRSAREFYDSGYVGKVMPDREVKSNERSVVPKSERGARDGRSPETLFMEKGEPIDSISVIVHGLNDAHFKQVMRNFLQLMAKRDLDIDFVFKMGLTDMRDKEIRSIRYQVWALEGEVWNVREIPERYQAIRKSPTWIVNTERGEILVEGFPTLDEFVNAKGEFIDGRILAGESGVEVEVHRNGVGETTF